MVSFFFKTQKNKRFEIKPRYYDERKEKLEELMNEKALSETSHTRLSKGSLRRQWDQRSYYHSEKKKTNKRLIIIMLVLIFLAWYYLINDNYFLSGIL
jgi:Flp pilus assembly protein TadB